MGFLRYLCLAVSLIVAYFTRGIVLDKTKLKNPYTFLMIFGKPGSGKSTWLTMQAYKHAKKGWKVYQNISGCEIGEKFDIEKLRTGEWMPDGREEGKVILIIDEIGLAYDNRNFKGAFTPETLQFYKEHRHRNVKIIGASQTYDDFDKKLRKLCDRLYIVRRSLFRNLILVRPIQISIDITNPDGNENNNAGDGGGKIIDAYRYDLLIFWRWYSILRWARKFNTWGDTY